MMDKKERKRDVAVFANMMKDLMNDPLPDDLNTLDRDIQHFIYGRVSVLVKHNDNKPIGSVGDIGAVVGAALGDVLTEFVRGRLDQQQMATVFGNARENLLRAFDAKTPKYESAAEEQPAPEEASAE